MKEKSFKVFICVEKCVDCINNVYNITQCNSRMGKNEILKYSQLNWLLFIILKQKSFY